MDLLHIFAQNVRKYRVEQKISQEKLAELSGLHRTYISALERERRNISLENVARIANALGVEPYLLFIRDDIKEITNYKQEKLSWQM